MTILSGGVLVPIRDTSWSDRSRFPLRRETTTIGRSINSDIFVNHPSISRQHAELTWDNQGLLIAHISQTNDTLVNGTPVREPTYLTTGDTIELGDNICLRVEIFEEADQVATIPATRINRRISAILFADVVSYTMFAAADEAAIAKRLRRIFAMIETESKSAGGTVVNLAGDGVLILFSSVVSALDTAILVQTRLAELNRDMQADEKLHFRIGLNTGDVIFGNELVGENLYGDSINVAQRVQALAEPGGILLSGAFFEQIHGANYSEHKITRVADAQMIDREIELYKVELRA